jgi:hypothetical protein
MAPHMNNLPHRQIEEFHHGASREGHGGPQESERPRLLWPTVALPCSSVVNPYLQTPQPPDAPRPVTGSQPGETPCNVKTTVLCSYLT